jgi:hypothetical protein
MAAMDGGQARPEQGIRERISREELLARSPRKSATILPLALSGILPRLNKSTRTNNIRM